MKTVTLEVTSQQAVKRRFVHAFKGEKQGSHISFASPALLFKILTGKRWELLNAMTGAGSMSIREAARRVDRDVKAVHGDITALLHAGLLERTADGKIVFPYDAVRVNFVLQAA